MKDTKRYSRRWGSKGIRGGDCPGPTREISCSDSNVTCLEKDLLDSELIRRQQRHVLTQLVLLLKIFTLLHDFLAHRPRQHQVAITDQLPDQLQQTRQHLLVRLRTAASSAHVCTLKVICSDFFTKLIKSSY